MPPLQLFHQVLDVDIQLSCGLLFVLFDVTKVLSLACQYEELFSKLLANASNTLSDDVWSSADICSFKVFRLSVASVPAKKRIVSTCASFGVVSHCVVELQSGGEMFPCCRLVLSVPIHPGKHLWWYWYAGHRSLCENLDISLWEGVMVLK